MVSGNCMYIFLAGHDIDDFYMSLLHLPFENIRILLGGSFDARLDLNPSWGVTV